MHRKRRSTASVKRKVLWIFLPKINAGRKKCNFTHGLGQKKCDKYDRIDILLEKLYDYTVKHLADEEAYMESIHYNKLFTQKVQHQAFIEKLDEFMESHNKEEENQDEQIMKILTYLTEWLVNHILYVDGQIPQE